MMSRVLCKFFHYFLYIYQFIEYFMHIFMHIMYNYSFILLLLSFFFWFLFTKTLSTMANTPKAIAIHSFISNRKYSSTAIIVRTSNTIAVKVNLFCAINFFIIIPRWQRKNFIIYNFIIFSSLCLYIMYINKLYRWYLYLDNHINMVHNEFTNQ